MNKQDKCCIPLYHGRCCCTCAYRIIDYSHPCTDGGKANAPRGYICLAPELHQAYSGWAEHGMCEMHDFKRKPEDLMEKYDDNIRE